MHRVPVRLGRIVTLRRGGLALSGSHIRVVHLAAGARLFSSPPSSSEQVDANRAHARDTALRHLAKIHVQVGKEFLWVGGYFRGESSKLHL